MANIVAITGRPNVGKSTLFNRLVGYRKAIQDNQSGVTRDRHYARAEWTNHFFTIIDTGGYVPDSKDVFEAGIRKQVEEALQEATVILFLVDVITGLTDYDKAFAQVLRRVGKPVIVVANKSDTIEKGYGSIEFYELGFDDLYTISAENGSGTGDLLDKIVSFLPSQEVEDPLAHLPRISILGRPNVGKSSFLNLLLGKERAIVTDIAGTTRDSIDSVYKAYGKEFVITDTAGLRRKSRTKEDLEFYSTMRSIKAMHDSTVCIVMIDAQEGLHAQDLNIIALAVRNRKGCVLLVNKWDKVEKDTKTAVEMKKAIEQRLGRMAFIPILFTSMVTKQRVFQAIETAMQVSDNLTKRIPTSKINEILLPEVTQNPPPPYRGKMVRIKFIQQPPTKTPAFVFYCNHPNHVKEPYKNFLENLIRKHFGFEGVPVRIFIRQK